MNKTLYLLVGRSASGKTTIANILEKEYSKKQVSSYTTRAPRYEGECGHTFISKEEFNNLKDLVSYTFYNGNDYGVTTSMLDESNIFVVDVPGVESLLQKYKTDRQICIIYFNANVYTRINRLLERGDSDSEIVSRLLTDEKDDWWDKIDAIVWHHKHLLGKNVKAYSINANGDVRDVLRKIRYYIMEENDNGDSM